VNAHPIALLTLETQQDDRRLIDLSLFGRGDRPQKTARR